MLLSDSFRRLCIILIALGSLVGCRGAAPFGAGITKEMDDATPPIYGVSLSGQGNRVALLGTTGSYTVTLTNVGLRPDTYTITATAKLGWADFSQVPRTAALEPGQSSSFTVGVAVPLTGSIGQEELIYLLAESSHTLDDDATYITIVSELPSQP